MSTAFKDHFSRHASVYRDARPGYPQALYRWLVRQLPSAASTRAWDCATGNGQVAEVLCSHVDAVIATDASAAQIANAPMDTQVEYRAAPAESSGLDPGSVHLITVAQALHWFDQPRFYAEALRVLDVRGVLAIWTYQQVTVSGDVDAVVDRLYGETLDAYWPPERVHVEQGYRGILPDWQRLAVPRFETACDWTVATLAAYLRSWSATQRFIRAKGFDPVAACYGELAKAFGEGRRRVRWPLVVHVFRRPDPD